MDWKKCQQFNMRKKLKISTFEVFDKRVAVQLNQLPKRQKKKG